MNNRLLVLLALVVLGACTTPLMHETTPPAITFYTSLSPPTPITKLSVDPQSPTSIPIVVEAQDPGGVQFITLAFQTTVAPDKYGTCGNSNCCPNTKYNYAIFPNCMATCTSVKTAGVAKDGPYPYEPVPVNPKPSVNPFSGGSAPTMLFNSSTLNGPFTCKPLGGFTGAARPYGETINAVATAMNYSSKSIMVLLPITFTPCANPKGGPCDSR
jgi:hypothetical protein